MPEKRSTGALLAACTLLSTTAFALPAAGFNGVCFYEHPDMLGAEYCYAADTPDVGAAANDRFSSFKTFGDAYAIIYEHSNYQGGHSTVMMNAFEMSYLNDAVSSVQIRHRKRKDFACVFEHTNYKGTGSCAEAGSGVPYMPFYNQASSVLIAGHAMVNGYAYDNYNTSQRYAGFYRSYGRLSEAGWNDDFDSFQVLDWNVTQDGWDNRRRPTLRAQEQFATNSRLYKTTLIGTHNAYNADEYVATFSGHNQDASLAEQLDMGARVLEIDIHGNGTIVYHTPETGVVGARRELTKYLLEIDNWLKGADDDDVIFIKIEDLMDGGDQPEEWAAWNITKTLGDLVYRKPNGSTDNLNLPAELSVKDIVRAGKRIVFWSYAAGESNANYRNIVWQRGGSEDSRDTDWNSSCGNQPSEWGNAGAWSLINEDARWGAYLVGVGGQIPDNQLRAALECGKMSLMADELTWDDSARFWAFSWAFPNGGSGTSGECGVYQRDNKSIQSDACGSVRPFVCRKPDDSLFVSSGSAAWNQGNILCNAESAGAVFGTVSNAREGRLLREAQANAGQVVTWINARKFGTEWVAQPEKQFFALVEQRSGKCLDVPGDDNALYNGQRVQLWDCQASASDQKWYYDTTTGQLRNKANPDYCLDNTGQTWNGGQIGIHACVNHVNLQFDWVADYLHSRGNGDFVVDASGDWNGAAVTSWQYHGGNNQRWKRRYP